MPQHKQTTDTHNLMTKDAVERQPRAVQSRSVQQSSQDTSAAQVIWCLGMYASASTWLFNVIRQMLEATAGPPVSAAFIGSGQPSLLWPRPGRHLVKSHEIDCSAVTASLARDATRIFITVRDSRDAVSSLMRYHGYAFSRALALTEASALLCLRFAHDERALLLDYESGFFDAPNTLPAIAEHLGVHISSRAAEGIFNGLCRASVEAQIARMVDRPGMLLNRATGDRLDPATQWHSHHADEPVRSDAGGTH